jgi:hypothetical protein
MGDREGRSMFIQTTLVVLVAALAAGYLAWQAYRAWKGGCGSGCGSGGCAPAKGGKSGLIPPDELLVRVQKRRSGEGGGE